MTTGLPSPLRSGSFAVGEAVVILDLLPDAGGVHLKLIRVSSEHMREGHGTRALVALCEAADREGLTISLTIAPIHPAGMNLRQLRTWYRRHGFVGIRHTRRMTRYPKTPMNPFPQPLNDDTYYIGAAEVRLSSSSSDDELCLSLIYVEAQDRRQGHGERALAALCEAADRDNKTLVLSVEQLGEGGANDSQLRAWYRRHGFILPRGKRYRMHRRPR